MSIVTWNFWWEIFIWNHIRNKLQMIRKDLNHQISIVNIQILIVAPAIWRVAVGITCAVMPCVRADIWWTSAGKVWWRVTINSIESSLVHWMKMWIGFDWLLIREKRGPTNGKQSKKNQRQYERFLKWENKFWIKLMNARNLMIIII